MVSIKDVARAAGVSDKTVSRVVNGEPNVTPDTSERVRLAISALGYIPNLAARSIRSSRTNILGIITDFVATTPYSGDIVRGIQSWAEANGRTVLLASTDGNPEKEREIWRTFAAHRIDGVLFVAMYRRVVSPETGGVTIPTVLVNARPEVVGSHASIEPDDFGGAQALARHVLGLGHRRVGYVQLNPLLLGATQRLEGFLAVAREAGLPAEDVRIRLGMEGPIGREENFVYREVRGLLSDANRPTALFCGNDEMALQAYLAALHLGLRVPEDVTIVGYDDFRTVSLGLKPELTTAALPYFDLGWQGAEKLGETIEAPAAARDQRVLGCPLVVRGSSGPPPR